MVNKAGKNTFRNIYLCVCVCLIGLKTSLCCCCLLRYSCMVNTEDVLLAILAQELWEVMTASCFCSNIKKGVVRKINFHSWWKNKYRDNKTKRNNKITLLSSFQVQTALPVSCSVELEAKEQNNKIRRFIISYWLTVNLIFSFSNGRCSIRYFTSFFFKL